MVASPRSILLTTACKRACSNGRCRTTNAGMACRSLVEAAYSSTHLERARRLFCPTVTTRCANASPRAVSIWYAPSRFRPRTGAPSGAAAMTHSALGARSPKYSSREAATMVCAILVTVVPGHALFASRTSATSRVTTPNARVPENDTGTASKLRGASRRYWRRAKNARARRPGVPDNPTIADTHRFGTSRRGTSSGSGDDENNSRAIALYASPSPSA